MSRNLLVPLVVQILLSVMMSPIVSADFTFFADRVAWEAEASNRGFLWGEEDFDDGGGSLKFGEVEVRLPSHLGFNEGKVVDQGEAWGFHIGVHPDILGCDWSCVLGPIGGIGINLENVELRPHAERFIHVWSSPKRPDGLEGLWFPDPSDFVFEEREYPGNGFVGVLFDSPREAQGFGFGRFSGKLQADNLVVASFPVPEPSSLSLLAVAFMTLSLFRKRNP